MRKLVKTKWFKCLAKISNPRYFSKVLHDFLNVPYSRNAEGFWALALDRVHTWSSSRDAFIRVSTFRKCDLPTTENASSHGNAIWEIAFLYSKSIGGYLVACSQMVPLKDIIITWSVYHHHMFSYLFFCLPLFFLLFFIWSSIVVEVFLWLFFFLCVRLFVFLMFAIYWR